VHEPDIAPLARRLAEENNVDWRRLSGTGEDGRVVERDVLGYLARVMAGEEAVDPTPEPVPEGMEAWPADDVGRYGASHLDDDEPTSPPTLDDDLFLFEDPVPPEPGGFDDALFVDADDGEPYAAVVEEDAAGREDDGHVIDAPAGSEGEGEGEGEDGVWLVGDDAPEDDEAGVPAETLAADFGEATDRGGADDPGDEMRLDELPDLTENDHEVDARSSEDDGARLAGGRDALELPDLFADAGSVQDDAAAQHDELSLDTSAGADLWEADADADADGSTESPADPVPAAVAASEPAPPVGARGDEGSIGATGPVPPALAYSLVRHGQVWRRRFDDRPLRQVASDAAVALDVPPTTVVVLLMARAASRAGVANGSVDAWRWRREGADRLVIDGGAAVREAVQRIEKRASTADAPAASLVVADLGDLDVDEAVLHLEAPVLALGRSGADGAWLSLSGDDLDGRAAEGLARVAELLGSPVRLLL
jgi:hypothetical protein